MKIKNIAKYLLVLSASVMLLGAPAMAADSPVEDNEVILKEEEGPTREEAYMWFYRTYEGRRQKRLWSLTYQYWVTDWIDIDPC